MWMLLASLGCGTPGVEPMGDGDGDAEVGLTFIGAEVDPGFGGPDVADEDPLTSADVVIVGAGTAGMAAAWEAIEAGARVLLIERDDAPGGSADWAGRMWAAGTKTQERQGIDDSPEQALGEWADFTNGDPEDPLVQRFVYESAETLDWLESFGMRFVAVADDPETGSVPRIHEPDGEGAVSAGVLIDSLEPVTWTNTEGTALVKRDGRVIGVRVRNLDDGTTGWVEAGAVVMATGGLVRNEERLLAAAPALADIGWVNEAFEHMDGNGLDMIEAVGGALSNLDSIGVYAHAVDDPRFDEGGVPLLVLGVSNTLVVDPNGKRIMDEDETRGFAAGRALIERGGLFVISDAPTFDETEFMALPFGWGVDSFEDIEQPFLTSYDYELMVDVPTADTPEDLALLLGIDPDTFADTLDRYNSLVEGGEDVDFGKDLEHSIELTHAPFYAIALRPGPSKSYGGATLGENTEVLDVNGDPIPGLYAAGEVAGVLGGTQVGWGFSGSISACWWGGRISGQAAAAEALSRAKKP